MSVPALSELSALFANEQSTLQQLRSVLEAESSTLLDRDMLAIEGTAQQKIKALNDYQKQVNARLSFLLEHEFEGSEQGLLTLVSSFPNDTQDQLIDQWHTLKQGFEDVIMQNERNGIVIFHSQLRNRNLLNILHGSKNEPNLYNGSGAAKGQSQRQSLGEA
jgi:flagellar biosynthesis/type III secretory pathway chaperone